MQAAPTPNEPPSTGATSAPHGVRVSSMQVRALSEGIQHVGSDANAFIARTGIDVSRLSDPTSWFSLEEFDALLVAAMQITNDPAFGLHWGERSPMMQLDLAPTLIASAPTMRGAFECILQLQPVLATRPEFHFNVQRDRSTLVIDPMALSEPGLRARSDLVVAGLMRLFTYLGEVDALRRIDFAHACPPAYASEYQRLFGSIVRFDQPQTCIVFASSALERTQPVRNPELHQAMRDRTEQMRQRVLGQLSYAEQLEQHIRSALPRVMSMADAARVLELSERSLRRRLAEENLSFSSLVDRVQYRFANEMLSDGRKTVKEIAYALGFNSVSGFHRAFRRWTGSSPARERSPRARS